MGSNPQEVHFGSQPPKNAEVVFGKTPETEETNVSIEGDNDPSIVGVVPVYAGGDEVPDEAATDAAGNESGAADDAAADDDEA